MSRLALLATAVSLTLGATPAFATFSDYNGNDTVATQEQGNTAAVGQMAPGYAGWNNAPPVIGPVIGVVTAPFAMTTGRWAQPNPTCGLYHDFNGRYTSLCGL